LARQIGPETIVADVLVHAPGAAAVFLARRMHCVGCDLARFETVADAARIYRQPVDQVVAELRRVAHAAAGREQLGWVD
jgi:hybrid cluster-associated redox disulfide protein